MVGNLAKKLQTQETVKEIDVAEAPVKWCAVSLSEMISRGKRLEASVFDVAGKQARILIKNCKYPVKNICGENGFATAFTGPRFKRVWVEESEFPIYQPSTILDIQPKPDGYISKLTHTNIEDLRVKKGQLLLTCSGTIGKVAYVSETLDEKIFSHDLLRINCKNPNDAGFLYTYLKSNIGNTILLTNSYGAVITHIEAEHLEEIPIPNPPEAIKKQIHDLIQKSFSLRDESNKLIDQATHLLVSELKLPPISELKKAIRKENLPEVFNVKLSCLFGRLDASFHVSIVDIIQEHLIKNSAEVTKISDNRISKQIILAGVFKRIYVEKEYGIPFLGGREIVQLSPNVEKHLSIAHHKSRYEKELKVRKNNILITDRGTIGVVAFVPKHFENCAVSQNVLKLVPANDEVAGYIYVFLNSEYGRALIQKQTYGSVVDMIDNKNLGDVSIPLLKDEKIQKEINNLALDANNKRFEAFDLENRAIKIMENILMPNK